MNAQQRMTDYLKGFRDRAVSHYIQYIIHILPFNQERAFDLVTTKQMLVYSALIVKVDILFL